MELTIREIDVIKLNLSPGDKLFVKLKGDDFEVEDTMQSLQKALSRVFPDNQVMVMAMGKDNDLDMTVIKQNSENKACSPISYCVDCNCGKKQELQNLGDEDATS